MVSVNAETVQDIIELDFSSAAITRYSDGKDFLLIYDTDRRGLFSFNLGEELGNDNSAKQTWTPVGTPMENHFTGMRGDNIISSTPWTPNYMNSEHLYLLG